MDLQTMTRNQSFFYFTSTLSITNSIGKISTFVVISLGDDNYRTDARNPIYLFTRHKPNLPKGRTEIDTLYILFD